MATCNFWSVMYQFARKNFCFSSRKSKAKYETSNIVLLQLRRMQHFFILLFIVPLLKQTNSLEIFFAQGDVQFRSQNKFTFSLQKCQYSSEKFVIHSIKTKKLILMYSCQNLKICLKTNLINLKSEPCVATQFALKMLEVAPFHQKYEDVSKIIISVSVS